MRTLIALLLALTVALPAAASDVASYWFADISDSVHRVDIATIAENDVTDGCNPPVNSLYCPENNVTRGQMAKFIVRAEGWPLVRDEPVCSDTASSVHVHNIATLVDRGVATCIGGESGPFRPDWDLARIVMIRWAWSAGWCGHQLANVEVFDDVTLDDPVLARDVPYVWACWRTGFVRGYSGTNLMGPFDPVSREQMASFIVRGAGL